MKTFIFLSIVLGFAALIVASLVFRSERAANALHFFQRAMFAYVVAVLLLAAWRVYNDGFGPVF